MELTHNDNGKKGIFFAEKEGEVTAEITYYWNDDDTITIDHTYVNSEKHERGSGKKLIEAVIALARDNNLKIIPVCSFAKAQFEKNADWKDVLHLN
jgi:predicted GNAT family acetyltransferase